MSREDGCFSYREHGTKKGGAQRGGLFHQDANFRKGEVVNEAFEQTPVREGKAGAKDERYLRGNGVKKERVCRQMRED